MVPFDCSNLFSKYERAECVVIRNEARITLWTRDGDHEHLVLDINKIANFLEQCRRSQQTPEN